MQSALMIPPPILTLIVVCKTFHEFQKPLRYGLLCLPLSKICLKKRTHGFHYYTRRVITSEWVCLRA